MREPNEQTEALRDAHRVELAVWTVCTVCGVGVILNTLGSDFESRPLALQGETVTLAIVLSLGAASAWRQRSRAHARVGPRTQLAAITLRVSLGVPLFLFAIVVAASGFAA